MGYLGSDLDDYYSYQLVDRVLKQIKAGDTGSTIQLKASLKKVIEELGMSKEFEIKELYKVCSNVPSLLPSQWDDYAKVKRILRKYGFKIDDKTNELTDPSSWIELSFRDVKYLDHNFEVIWDFKKREAEIRLK